MREFSLIGIVGIFMQTILLSSVWAMDPVIDKPGIIAPEDQGNSFANTNEVEKRRQVEVWNSNLSFQVDNQKPDKNNS